MQIWSINILKKCNSQTKLKLKKSKNQIKTAYLVMQQKHNSL